MLFTLRKSNEDYNIDDRLTNIKLMLNQIIEYCNNSNSVNISNMFIDAYLHTAEYILYTLLKKLEEKQSNDKTNDCFCNTNSKCE